MDFPSHFLHYLESLKLSVVAGVPPFVLLCLILPRLSSHIFQDTSHIF